MSMSTREENTRPLSTCPSNIPQKQGLYDPAFEHDSCGVGFICTIKGTKSHTIVEKGLEILQRMSHRGAVGADPKTGDGAGILIQTPHTFFQRVCREQHISLPPHGEYGVGLVFLPSGKSEQEQCIACLETIIREKKCTLLGWRDVPVRSDIIGKTAQETQPHIRHLFIQKPTHITDQMEFERVLYVIRKSAENAIRESNLSLPHKKSFYIPSLSSKTLVYKGLLTPEQVGEFFIDLAAPDMHSAFALIHSRYSTNTFPTWDLAQPFRLLAHNGEINTLRGNINWMHARHSLLKSELFGNDIKHLLPVIVPGGSDSASLDNAVELLMLSGRPLAHLMMMLVPSAYENDVLMDEKLRAFYEYHACLMESWDGPAALAFTDGTQIGATLDRNGLRPARYLITYDDLVIMASEMGVLDVAPENIKVSGRLMPGTMLLIDTQQGRIISDEEIKSLVSSSKPYKEWLAKHLVDFGTLPSSHHNAQTVHTSETEHTQLKTFGYSREDMKMILRPMAEEGKEPVGSMGDDMPSAVLSTKPRLLYHYFKQLFAQVTNPPIDSIREEIVMSLTSYIGPERNILDETPEHCHRLKVKEPILLDSELEKIKSIGVNNFRTKTISMLFNAHDANDFSASLNRICDEAAHAIHDGYTFVVLSDRGVNENYMALPALLAIGAVHHHLVKKSLRKQIGIILESGEPREVHHFALLFGYGADCINPYMAYRAVKHLIDTGMLSMDYGTAIHHYHKAVSKGILKILSKMGISTLQSYRNAQIFEALGIGKSVIDRCFWGTPSRIGGVDFETIRKETLLRHADAFPSEKPQTPLLATGGMYQWKRDGEFHLWNPESIATLQDAVRKGDFELFKKFSNLINNQDGHPTTLRSLLTFKKTEPIPVEDVESVSTIVTRFATGAMSFGSISGATHETLAIAMNRLKGKSNTGEGGEDPARFTHMPNGDSKRSAIKQVASGRFGVTSNYCANADELQIKIAQGAKPGEGGQLPGHKVSVTIARTRYTTPGVTLISPPPHHDIYSIEDLAQLIFDLKNANPFARISVKLVSEIGVGTVAAGVAKAHADMILISGGDGGTGASPLSSIKHAGLPWELGLSETHQTLVLNDLRSRVRLQTDGQLRTGRDVAIAALLGAEEFGFCTAPLVSLGCVMLRHCHLNSCALGVATQDALLEQRFTGKPEYVMNFMHFVAQELREIMAQLGVRTVDELVGKTELLEVNNALLPWKAQHIDFSNILYKPVVPNHVETRCTRTQDHGIAYVLDRELIRQAQPALNERKEVKISTKISNVNRTTGAMLSYEVSKNCGENGLPDETIHCMFTGVAGQSFGAFLAHGITFELEGLANDYVGKGISGGKIIIYPSKKAAYKPEHNILIGNTTFYGAIYGEAYIRGKAGERFCIRNSGLNAVVEGVGDHGCEYMTGGRVVVLGQTGINFAAGMSGGIAYVYDVAGDFRKKCNMEMVEVTSTLNDEDITTIRSLLHNHQQHTHSTVADAVLANEHHELKKFVKVLPLEYKRILEQRNFEEKLGVGEEE